MNKNTKFLMSAAIAGLMSAGAVHAADKHAAKAAHDEVKGQCDGGNACKGKSACKTAQNECAGHNGCKGKGYVETTKAECEKAHGKFAAAKEM